MKLPLLRSLKARLCGAAALLFAAGCAAPDLSLLQGPYAGLSSLQYSGSQKPVELIRREIAAAGSDEAKLEVIEGKLLALLDDSGTSFAGRQAICEALGQIYAARPARLDMPIAPVLVSMFSDPGLADLARVALERDPRPAVDSLLLSQLPVSRGRVQIGLIESLGNRRVAAAVPAIAAFLGDPDSATAAAAAKALGQIGTEAAAQALSRAPDPAAHSVAEARFDCAQRLPEGEARAVYVELSTTAAVPEPVRVAALLAQLSLEPGGQAQQIASILAGQDGALKAALENKLASLPQGVVTQVAASGFKGWDLSTQVSVISALGRIGDPAALPLLLNAARSGDESLRLAAVRAMGAVPGDREVANLLAEAAQKPGALGSAARLSLSTLTGAGVAQAVLDGATDTSSPQRPIFLEELALRNTPGAAAVLLGTRGDHLVWVRCAALDGLALVAAPEEEKTLLLWYISATDSTEQTHSLRAVVGTAARNPDPKARIEPVTDLFGGAAPAIQGRLLTVLSRLGGPEGAGYVANLALGKEPKLATSAVAALGHWSDPSALRFLTDIAEKGALEPVRKMATEGALQLLKEDSGKLTPEEKKFVERLKASTHDATLQGRLDSLRKLPE